MSYSFVARGATKKDALADLDKQMKHLATHQPAHVEANAVSACAAAFLGALAEPTKAQAVEIAVAGTLSGAWEGLKCTAVSGAQVNINARLV